MNHKLLKILEALYFSDALPSSLMDLKVSLN